MSTLRFLRGEFRDLLAVWRRDWMIDLPLALASASLMFAVGRGWL